VFKKICILASLSQQSAIEEAVQHYKSEGWLVDYPMEQRDKTQFEINFDYICRIAAATRAAAIPKYDGSFGESVTYEMAIAKYLGTSVEVYHPKIKKEVKFVSGGVRETICTDCIHREVCIYKQTYLEYLEMSEKMRSNYKNDISFINHTDPDCKYCMKKSSIMLK
jgi:hypothetical protein